MYHRIIRGLSGAMLVLLAVEAQSQAVPQRPSDVDPAVAMQLMQRLRSSGLTPEQIRARLQAAGYPPELLDAYLGGGAGAGAVANDQVFAAVRSLGVMDSVAMDSLRVRQAVRNRSQGPVDPVLERFADSLRVSVDSIDIVADPLPEDIGRRLDAWRAARYRALRLARQQVDSGYTLFGMNLFDADRTDFEPNLAGPVDANYRLGPGDELVLILTGDVEAAYELPVTREGFIVIPQVGQVSVANMTLAQVEASLGARLARVYTGVGRGVNASTRYTVSVARLRSNQVFVTGDVEQPGSHRISSAGTAMTAVYAAGGPTANGSLRAIEIRRGSQTVGTFDLYDYLLRGNSSNDPRLQSGDVVFVPSRGPRVRIWGEVIRPATYELAQGEQLDDLLRAAGGFTAAADRRRVQIERILPPSQRHSSGSDRVVIDVTSADLATGFGPEVPLQGGDVVRVFEIADRVRNQIVVSGNVWAPGRVAFQPGMRLSDALRRAGGVKPDTYLGQALVTRLQPDSTRVQLRAALADTSGVVVDDIVLNDADEIRIFSQTEFRPQRYVVVSGAVREGGRFPYREGMTLRDLVLLAGGLEESALLTEAEVARMPESRAEGAKAVTHRVRLDSTYLFERNGDGSYNGPPGVPASGTAPDVVLQPYDNVLIFRQPDWSLPESVVLTGEVARPGRYTLRSKNERLSDVIQRAGGLTHEAYAGGVVFVRSRDRIGRIGLDLPGVLRNQRHRDNLLLVDGDSIAIPVFTPVVNVRGAVNALVGVAYVPGANIQYYIDAAGGPNGTGDAKRAFVTQPNGKVQTRQTRTLWPDGLPEPLPGSIVYVPVRGPETVSMSIGSIASTLASVLGALATVLVLANQL